MDFRKRTNQENSTEIKAKKRRLKYTEKEDKLIEKAVLDEIGRTDGPGLSGYNLWNNIKARLHHIPGLKNRSATSLKFRFLDHIKPLLLDNDHSSDDSSSDNSSSKSSTASAEHLTSRPKMGERVFENENLLVKMRNEIDDEPSLKDKSVREEKKARRVEKAKKVKSVKTTNFKHENTKSDEELSCGVLSSDGSSSKSRPTKGKKVSKEKHVVEKGDEMSSEPNLKDKSVRVKDKTLKKFGKIKSEKYSTSKTVEKKMFTLKDDKLLLASVEKLNGSCFGLDLTKRKIWHKVRELLRETETLKNVSARKLKHRFFEHVQPNIMLGAFLDEPTKGKKGNVVKETLESANVENEVKVSLDSANVENMVKERLLSANVENVYKERSESASVKVSPKGIEMNISSENTPNPGPSRVDDVRQ